MRSRAVSLPLACWAAMRRSPPPDARLVAALFELFQDVLHAQPALPCTDGRRSARRPAWQAQAWADATSAQLLARGLQPAHLERALGVDRPASARRSSVEIRSVDLSGRQARCGQGAVGRPSHHGSCASTSADMAAGAKATAQASGADAAGFSLARRRPGRFGQDASRRRPPRRLCAQAGILADATADDHSGGLRSRSAQAGRNSRHATAQDARFTPQMMEQVKPQLANIQGYLNKLGPIQTVSFLGEQTAPTPSASPSRAGRPSGSCISTRPARSTACSSSPKARPRGVISRF